MKSSKNHSKKKTSLYKERDEEKRAKFIEVIEQFPREKLVYVDESGIDSYISREYGWSERGTKVIGEVSGRRYARESFVAGLNEQKVVAPICYRGTMDTVLFNFWLSNFLLPELGPGYTIVMDNAAFHKPDKTKQIIEKNSCRLLLLPPYSPDLNPIEKFWANLKARVRNIINHVASLAEAIDLAFNMDHLNFK